jgi:hypothetical protein
VNQAWQLRHEGNELEVVDPPLADSCSPDELSRYMHIYRFIMRSRRSLIKTYHVICCLDAEKWKSNSSPTWTAGQHFLRGDSHTNMRLMLAIGPSIYGLTISGISSSVEEADHWAVTISDIHWSLTCTVFCRVR